MDPSDTVAPSIQHGSFVASRRARKRWFPVTLYERALPNKRLERV